MALDTYSKLLLLIDLLALLFLRQYLENALMLVPFGVLMVLVWVWLYRVFAPLKFAWPALVSLVAAIGLYVPNAYARILSAAFLAPACASAIAKLVGSETEARTGTRPG